MEFLNLTGLAFLALGVPVVLLCLLRMRRLIERVPSTLLGGPGAGDVGVVVLPSAY